MVAVPKGSRQLDADKLQLARAAHQKTRGQLTDARRQVRWLEMLLAHAEDGLAGVMLLSAKFGSTHGPQDWYAGRDAVGRAERAVKDLKMMRNHKTAMLENDAEERAEAKRKPTHDEPLDCY